MTEFFFLFFCLNIFLSIQAFTTRKWFYYPLGIIYLCGAALLASYPGLIPCMIALPLLLGLLWISKGKSIPKFLHLTVLLLTPILFCLKAYPPNEPALSLHLTGKTSLEEVEWKAPHTPLQKESLTTHEVFLSLEKEIITDFFYGEILGIRYEQLRLCTFLHWIGCHDPIHIECITGEYRSPGKIGRYPTKVITWNSASGSLWSKLFYGKIPPFWIRSAELRSVYVPLEDAEGKPLQRSFTFCQLLNGK